MHPLQDPDVAVVQVLDLASATPGINGAARVCQAFAVHQELFSHHPGLRILQV